MQKLFVLGTAHAVPDEHHENTHFAIIGTERQILVDCVGNPVVRLKQAGIEIDKLTDLFLTHFHPDHVSGVPSLLMSMWLLGRSAPLHIYGLHDTLDRVEKLMGFYDWSQWPDFFSVIFHRLPAETMTLALESEEFTIYTSPVEHLIPTIGMRIESTKTRKVIAYSCDTQPSEAVVELAAEADILIHEATGPFEGHSSASQAGSIASQAKVGSLYLVHYDPEKTALETQAKKEFPGPVIRAEDFMVIEF